MNVDALLERLKGAKASLDRLEKAIGRARDGESWEPIVLADALAQAAADPTMDDELRRLAAQLGPAVEQGAQMRLLELEATLRDICTKHRWKLDGQWPSFFVQRGVEIHVQEADRTLTLGGDPSPSLAPATLERLLAAAVKTLLPARFDPRAFVSDVARAYDIASRHTGGQVPVWDVYRELVIASQRPSLWRDARAKRFQELTVDQFRGRLGAALESGATAAADGRELRLLPPINPKDAIFIYQPAESRFGFVGRIEFVAAEKS